MISDLAGKPADPPALAFRYSDSGMMLYRRRNAFEIPRPIEGSTKLETLWSVIPLLIAMTIFFWGAKVYFAQYRPAKNAIEVYVHRVRRKLEPFLLERPTVMLRMLQAEARRLRDSNRWQ